MFVLTVTFFAVPFPMFVTFTIMFMYSPASMFVVFEFIVIIKSTVSSTLKFNES